MTNIPWPTKKIGEICEERKEKNSNNERISVFTVSHIYGLIPYQKIFYKQVHSKDIKNYKIVNLYDFAFGLPTKDTLPYGMLELERKVLVSPAYIVFSVNNKNILFPKFLYYLFKTNYYKWKIIELAKSYSATRHGLPLKYNRLAEIEIPLPPLPVQQKIVKILDSIQEAVEIQEKIIEKTKELKKSLMNLLFRYGTKALSIKLLTSYRVSELESSEIEKLGIKLKKTEIGEIPEHWEVVSLGDVCRPRKEQLLPKENEIYVGLEHIDSGVIKLNRYGKGIEVKSLKNKFYPKDILYGKLRPYLDKAVIVEKEGISSTDLLVIRCDEKKILPLYLVNIIHTTTFLNFATNTMIGTNHPRTSWDSLKFFQFACPSISEQQEIAEILQTIDKKIEIEKRKKELYEELFKTMLNKIMSQEIDVELLDY
jgi:type I restriction enzyme S subunit